MRYLSVVCLIGMVVLTGSMTGTSFSSEIREQVTELEPIPSLIQSIRFPAHLEFCDIRVPLENPMVRADLEKDVPVMDPVNTTIPIRQTTDRYRICHLTVTSG